MVGHGLTLAPPLSKYERIKTAAFDYGLRHNVDFEAQLNVRREIKAQFSQ